MDDYSKESCYDSLFSPHHFEFCIDDMVDTTDAVEIADGHNIIAPTDYPAIRCNIIFNKAIATKGGAMHKSTIKADKMEKMEKKVTPSKTPSKIISKFYKRFDSENMTGNGKGESEKENVKECSNYQART